MNVTSCMKRNVVSVHAQTSIRDAANIFVKKHVGLLPVVDDDGKPVGVVGLRDMLTLELPASNACHLWHSKHVICYHL